jgi:hypothetical protein
LEGGNIRLQQISDFDKISDYIKILDFDAILRRLHSRCFRHHFTKSAFSTPFCVDCILAILGTILQCQHFSS